MPPELLTMNPMHSAAFDTHVFDPTFDATAFDDPKSDAAESGITIESIAVDVPKSRLWIKSHHFLCPRQTCLRFQLLKIRLRCY